MSRLWQWEFTHPSTERIRLEPSPFYNRKWVKIKKKLEYWIWYKLPGLGRRLHIFLMVDCPTIHRRLIFCVRLQNPYTTLSWLELSFLYDTTYGILWVDCFFCLFFPFFSLAISRLIFTDPVKWTTAALATGYDLWAAAISDTYYYDGEGRHCSIDEFFFFFPLFQF